MGQKKQLLITAAEAAMIYPKVKSNTIRQWLKRGVIRAAGYSGRRPLFKSKQLEAVLRERLPQLFTKD
jgi:helix-turn-helix protein